MKPHDSKPQSHSALRAAVLGCGGRGREHVEGLVADRRVKIVALADVRREAAEDLNLEFELGAAIYNDIDDLLNRERPGIAVIALWTGLHLPVFRACVAAGVRLVVCEKPMAATWEECQEIARLAEESRTMLTFCHQRRFASGNLEVRKHLDNGQFGEIRHMALFSPPHLLDCGTHSVDQALSFNREASVKWVHGAVDLSSTVEFFGIPAEGMFTGMFVFENGVTASIRAGRLDMDFWGGVRVTGTEGFVEAFWDGQVRSAAVYKDPCWQFPKTVETPGEEMIGVVRDAVDALENGVEPELSHRKALRASEILFALYKSARSGERVTLPLEGPIGNPLFDMLADRDKRIVAAHG